VPLESFIGPAVDALLAQARQRFGPEAEIIAVRTLRSGPGSAQFQVLAGDAESAAAERRHMSPNGGGHPLLTPAPGPEHFAHRREPAGGPRVIAFVGPTGVGKTTTIAKLATHPDYLRPGRIGLLCLDTYRVGAVEQIRTYADIAGLPLEVIYESADLPKALRRLSDRDLILVDTPGRGPRLQGDTQQVRQWLNQVAPHEVHLVLPAGLQSEQVRRAIAAYRGQGATHLLASKLDEAPDDWCLFDAAAETRMPMRWMSDGQDVPRDLRAAAPRLLAAVAALRVRTAEPAQVVA
jgi:flagellar biosynthesis protein FlhF